MSSARLVWLVVVVGCTPAAKTEPLWLHPEQRSGPRFDPFKPPDPERLEDWCKRGITPPTPEHDVLVIDRGGCAWGHCATLPIRLEASGRVLYLGHDRERCEVREKIVDRECVAQLFAYLDANHFTWWVPDVGGEIHDAPKQELFYGEHLVRFFEESSADGEQHLVAIRTVQRTLSLIADASLEWPWPSDSSCRGIDQKRFFGDLRTRRAR